MQTIFLLRKGGVMEDGGGGYNTFCSDFNHVLSQLLFD